MSEVLSAALRECSITVIYVIVVVLVKIIANINIIPTVIIQVPDRNTQTVAEVTLINTGLL